jgi:hypothetical protein
MSYWVIFDGPVFESRPRPIPVPARVADDDPGRAWWVRREVRRRAVSHWAPRGTQVAVRLDADGRGVVLTEGPAVVGRFRVEQVDGQMVRLRQSRGGHHDLPGSRPGKGRRGPATAATGTDG